MQCNMFISPNFPLVLDTSCSSSNFFIHSVSQDSDYLGSRVCLFDISCQIPSSTSSPQANKACLHNGLQSSGNVILNCQQLHCPWQTCESNCIDAQTIFFFFFFFDSQNTKSNYKSFMASPWQLEKFLSSGCRHAFNTMAMRSLQNFYPISS